MSRRRVSCPLTAQQLWDAVKIIRYKRQVPDIERITRYMNRTHNVSDDEVGRQINYCVRDGLLKVIKKIGSKGSKIGIEQEGYKLPDDKLEKDGHDWYCFECHSGGDRCSSKDLTPNIKKSQLNRLLKYTATKMKDRLPVALTDRQPPSNTSYLSERFAIQGQVKSPSIDVPSNFKWILNDKEDWRVDYLIYRPIDLHIMESKADCGKYEHLEEFRADIQTIVHNVVIYHGVHSNMADMARLMLRDCNTDLQEILECWLCYKHSNDKTLRNWFIKPCKPPHELVYARQKGYPYWPAKVIKENEECIDVRFFGGVHERAVVEKLYIRPISVNIHTLQVKRTSSWNRACEELKRYQKQLEKLREQTENFTKPFVDSSSSDESDLDGEVIKKVKADVDEIDVNKNEKIEENKEEAASKDNNENIKKNKSSSLKIAINTKNKTLTNDKTEKKITRGRGRPKKTLTPLLSQHSSEENEDTLLNQNKCLRSEKDKVLKGRGRPPKSVQIKSHTSSSSPILPPPPTEESSTSAFSESAVTNPKLTSPNTNERADVKIENEIEDYNISSTSSGKCHLLSKGNEEEIVSSSSSQNPAKRSVKTQTKPLDNKPSKEWIEKMEEEFEQEKQRIIAKLKKDYEQEITLMRQAHTAILSETKRKQWCVNCESEAIYHCCWNTSYCSPACQLQHWGADHKRHCRRKR
ncbi:hypothetical protein PGB90_000700 [Kerria lacca]